MRPEQLIEWADGLGSKVVPLRYLTKSPLEVGWSGGGLDRESLYRYLENGDINYGLLLGKRGGGLVDVDLDSEEARKIGGHFLPETGVMFGRQSYRRSHYIYDVDEPKGREAWVDPTDNKTIVEIRGNGHQTVLPPSVLTHKTKKDHTEPVLWSSHETPRKATWEELRKAAGKLAVAATLVRHWDEWATTRHNLVLALTGAFIRVGLTEAEIKTMVQLAGDLNNYPDTNVRVRAVEDTAEKLRNGETVITGWPRLEEIVENEKLVAKWKQWLGFYERDVPFSQNDVYNSSILIKTYGHDLRYDASRQQWMVWNGQCWEADQRGRILTYAKSTAEEIQRMASIVEDADKQQSMIKWSSQSRNLARMQAMIRIAQAEKQMAMVTGEFDRDINLLTVENGTINLETGSLQDPDRMDFISKIAPVKYDPDAYSHRWHRFLDEVLPDKELQRYVQKALGYTLTGSTIEEVFFIPYGVKGQNGKGTLLTPILLLLGDYAQQANVQSFVKQRYTRVRDDLAHMAGARMILTSEPSMHDVLDASTIKDITGGDTIRARFLYGKEFQFKPQLKLWMVTNHLPTADGLDHAIWRRIRVIPFEVHIPPEERDNSLKEAFMTDPFERSAILNWMMEGLALYNQEGLGNYGKIKAATETYRLESDTLHGFFEDRCEFDEKATVSRADFYEAYRHWCNDTGNDPINVASFKREVAADSRITPAKVQGFAVWRGVKLLKADPLSIFMDRVPNSTN